jgi:hypothetical protein
MPELPFNVRDACEWKGIEFDPPLGPNQSEAILSVQLNAQDCAGGSEL